MTIKKIPTNSRIDNNNMVDALFWIRESIHQTNELDKQNCYLMKAKQIIKMKIKSETKIINDYKERIANYELLLEDHKAARKELRENHAGDCKILYYHKQEIKRLQDLRQLCVQIIKDLEDVK